MEPDKLEPIAIIGINLKFPSDAVSPESFWKMLYEGRSVSGKVPEDRFNIDAFYHPDPARLDAFRVTNAHFLKEDPRAFDASFFSISPAEAAVLDPQQRCLLEGAYHTFENAGIPMHSLAGSNTSVYSASFGRDAEVFICRDTEFQSSYQATSSGASMLSNRLSYFFDLHGPSLTVDTACSSGLIAFHLACQSLWTGDAEQSLVCGSNTYLTPESMSVLDNAGFLSPDGRCHSFDHKANGYARGEGFGFVLLKPLKEALRDGNVIRAVVRATGVNQDGKTPSITAPSSVAQMELIRKTYEAGGLDLEMTEYVEAHGTGTIVGDPIEAEAIGRVFSEHREHPLHLGSVKANIGHLEGASGLAGLLKTILALEEGVIPPVAGLMKVNPAIDTERLRLQFNSSPVAWPSVPVRRASVSSFGYGGSNAHVVLEDAYNYLRLRNLTGIHKTQPVPRLSRAKNVHASAVTNGHVSGLSHGTSNGLSNGVSNGLSDGFGDGHPLINGHHDAITTSKRKFLAVLSAADEDGPRRQAVALDAHLASLTLEERTDSYYANLVHTLYRHRTVLGWRAYGVIDPLKEPELVSSLSRINFSIPSKTPVLHFVFSGQGAQTPGMGLELLRYPVFAQSLLDCDAYLQSLGCVWSVLDELRKYGEHSQIHKPALSQPLCTCIQLALIELLRSWNVTPASVCGHSSGEIAAAFCAGALTRESAWTVAYHRGVIAENLAQGHEAMAMMSVGLGENDILPWIGKEDSPAVGCINSPINVTLTGSEQSIDRLWHRLDQAEIFARKLDVSIAYHSEAMKAGSSAYLAAIRDIKSPPLPARKMGSSLQPVLMYSSITGNAITIPELANPAYWVKNLVSPVRFADAMSAMLTPRDKRTSHSIVEISPKPALRRPIHDTADCILAKDKYQYLLTLQDKSSNAESMLQLLGHLWSCGLNVDIGAANAVGSTTLPELLPDLPAYPFSRSKQYWQESRLSRNVSFRPFRRHGLLGLRAQDWNAAEASWRHIIRVQENPWVLDHGLNGSSIYPGSGMLVMAVEAARQLSANIQDQITGYRLKDVHFLKAIVIDESDQGSEAAIYMRPQNQATNNTRRVWYDWRIFRVSGGEWIESAYGSIRVEVEPETLPGLAEASRGRRERFAESVRATHRDSVSKCSLGVYHEQFYENLSTKSGFNYGPHFALLRDLSYDKAGHASARLNLRNYVASIPYAAEDPCVIHPSTLDAIGHLHIVALSKGGWQAIPTQMFSHVKDMWISHKLFALPGNPAMEVSTNETFRGFREVEFSACALLADSLEPVVVAEGLRTTAITSLSLGSGSVGDGTDRMCYGIEYMPDLSLMTPIETQEYLGCYFAADARYAPASKTDIDRGDAMSWHFMTTTAKKLETSGPRQYTDHLERYVAWLRAVVQEGDSWSLESRGLGGSLTIEQVLREADVPLQILTKAVGERLYEILTDQIPPLQIIFGGTLADDFYHSDIFTGSYRKLGTYLQILAHMNPRLRILECGAGTGSATAQIIPSLVYDAGNGNEGIHFAEYAFTDISPGFFETARERFRNVEKSMRFQKLDFEVEPMSQGFEAGAYDVVVAANCLHATADIVRALENVHKLLKPGGKLILVETTNVEIVSHGFIFGLVPGWWLRRGEWWDNCKKTDRGPLLTEDQWARVLPKGGFSGLDMVFRDYEVMPHHRISVLVTTAVSKEQVRSLPQLSGVPCAIVIDADSDVQCEIASRLKEKYLHQAAIFSLTEVKDNLQSDATVVCLAELDQHVLVSINEERFGAVKHIALAARRTLWVSDGGMPYGEIARGLGRTVNSERGEESFATLTLKRPSDRKAESIETINRVLTGLLIGADSRNETEYIEEESLIKVARVAPIAHLNEAVRVKISPSSLVKYSIGEEPKPRIHLTIDAPGLLETLFFQEDAIDPDLQVDTVEVEVMAAGLNLTDVAIALGQIPGEGFGLDGSGIVTRVGPRSNMRPGDRVIFYTSRESSLSTFQILPEVQILKIPDDMTLTAAALLPAVYGTAVYSLDYVAHLKQGESILIHEGAGSNGQAAIQLAQLRGAETFTTVDSEAERQLVQNLYRLPDSHIFSSRDTAFAKDIRLATNGRGVNVILNSLGGELLQESWDCIAPCGRFINLGKVDILANSRLPMGQFDKNVTFSAVDLTVLISETPLVMKAIMQDVLSLFKHHQHLHEPKPIRVLPASQLESGMRSLQAGKTSGKFAVDFSTVGDEIKYRPASRPSYFLNENATYVITGSFGGLGREIVRWMIERGARHFVLLSRRGANGTGALDFIRDVEESGAKVYAPACDIGDRKVVESVLQHVMSKMPPIKGCIHGAMVLKDSLLINMTAKSFQYALGPKVNGSWNLHELLPPGIDFFLLLSSMAGVIGDAGQSNYAAGNTFEDALARYRASIGLKAVAIDLSLIAEAGWANENYENLGQSIRGHKGLRLEQLMTLLDVLCDPSYDCHKPGAAQVIPIQDSPEDLYRMGQDGVLTWMSKPLFSGLHRMGEASQGRITGGENGGDEKVDYLALVHAAGSPVEAAEVITQGLVQKLARSLSLPAENLDIARPAHALGVDSLIAVQIRYWILKQLQVEVPVFMILEDQSLSELCQAIAAQVLGTVSD